MNMAGRNNNTSITCIGLCLSFLSFINANSADSSCPGPTQHYKDLGCTPVFKNPDSPCPQKYNCDHLRNFPTDKCFVNGHEYAIGETLREEDGEPCDLGCTCVPGSNVPKFNCASINCGFPVKPGCYWTHSAMSCCGIAEVCPEKEEDRPTCVVDGKTYKDGEYFEPASDSDKYCYCGQGYTGKNIDPFCRSRPGCGTILRNIDEVLGGCIPTYDHNQPPKSSCSWSSRCPSNNDAVIPRRTDSSEESKSATSEPADPGMMCHFGNLTMHVGDELNPGTDYNPMCLKCICEVPPIPTCQRVSDEQCEILKRNHENP